MCRGLIVTQDDVYSLGRHSDHGSPRVTSHYQGETTLNTGDHSVKSSHCIVGGGDSPVLSGPTEMSRHDLTEMPSSPALTPKTRLELV